MYQVTSRVVKIFKIADRPCMDYNYEQSRYNSRIDSKANKLWLMASLLWLATLRIRQTLDIFSPISFLCPMRKKERNPTLSLQIVRLKKVRCISQKVVIRI